MASATYSMIFLVFSLSNFVQGDRNDDKFRTDLNATQPQSSPNGESNNSFSQQQDTSAADVVRNMAMIITLSVAIIASLAILSYMFAKMAEKTAWCCLGFIPLSPNNLDRHAHHPRRPPIDWMRDGPLTHRAGLWDLDPVERMRVLQYFFAPHIRSFVATGESQIPPPQKDGSKKTAVDSQSSPAESRPEVDVESGSSVVEEVTLNNEDSEPGAPAGAASSENPSGNPLDDTVKYERTCCICLIEYDEKDKTCQVLTGPHCQHIFHAECCMEWLQKHDHCPYCRQEMITPEEFRQAAGHVLGPERVAHLKTWDCPTEPSDDGALEPPQTSTEEALPTP